jgi:hypothetical protein
VRIVKVAVMTVKRAVPAAAQNRNEEALKTENRGSPSIFHRRPLQKHPKGKQRSIKNKRSKKSNTLLTIRFLT